MTRAGAALLPLALSAACATRPLPPPVARRPPAPERPPALRERPAFSCRAPRSTPPWRPTFVTVADGPTRLTVTPVGVRPRGAPLQRARVRVVALQAQVGALGVELARAAGTNVWVQPEIAGARLTFAGEYTVEQLADLLRVVTLVLDVDARGIAIHEWSAVDERLRYRASAAREQAEFAATETRVIPVPEGVDPATVAGIFCQRYATARGWASVARRSLVVSDLAGSLALVDGLIAALDPARAPSAR